MAAGYQSRHSRKYLIGPATECNCSLSIGNLLGEERDANEKNGKSRPVTLNGALEYAEKVGTISRAIPQEGNEGRRQKRRGPTISVVNAV